MGGWIRRPIRYGVAPHVELSRVNAPRSCGWASRGVEGTLGPRASRARFAPEDRVAARWTSTRHLPFTQPLPRVCIPPPLLRDPLTDGGLWSRRHRHFGRNAAVRDDRGRRPIRARVHADVGGYADEPTARGQERWPGVDRLRRRRGPGRLRAERCDAGCTDARSGRASVREPRRHEVPRLDRGRRPRTAALEHGLRRR